MAHWWSLLPLILLAFSAISEGAKILVVFPFPSKSHSILGEGVTKLLLKAGHEVTYITTHPNKDPPSNLHQIDISTNVEMFPTNLGNLELILENKTPANDIKMFMAILTNLSKATFSNPNVQKLINDENQKFDLVIIEWMFSELYAGLSALYGCPYVWISSVDPHWLVMDLIDEPLNPAYNPDGISNNMPPFTFTQRIQELFSQIFVAFVRKFYLLRNERAEYEKIFAPLLAKKGRHLPSFDEIRYNASLMLGNSHVSIGKAVRLPQSYKPIGGYHIDSHVEALPQELKKIMDNAKNGVIYFSMGSNLKSKDLPDSIKKGLLDMFGQLKYTVIWKFEEVLDDVPKNVYILQWAPQPSILSHPKCVLFITHGGLLSTTETVHFGVPIIGIPVLADQNNNVERAVISGYALKVGLSYDLVYDLKIAIEEILRNPKYTEKVKELSLIYHDRPVPPAQELVHWVEHVIRTRGAPHLRSPALLVPWYQKMYLDLLAIIIASGYILKVLVRKLFSKKSPSIATKQAKQNKKKNN